MQYMLMFYQPQSEFDQRDEAAAQAYRAGWMDYVGAIRQAGVVQNGHGLQPPLTGTTLRVRGDKRQVQDFVIEVADLDAALEWAARAPCASTGGVEVRPVFTAPTM
jgi:hypothetical protein